MPRTEVGDLALRSSESQVRARTGVAPHLAAASVLAACRCPRSRRAWPRRARSSRSPSPFEVGDSSSRQLSRGAGGRSRPRHDGGRHLLPRGACAPIRATPNCSSAPSWRRCRTATCTEVARSGAPPRRRRTRRTASPTSCSGVEQLKQKHYVAARRAVRERRRRPRARHHRHAADRPGPMWRRATRRRRWRPSTASRTATSACSATTTAALIADLANDVPEATKRFKAAYASRQHDPAARRRLWRASKRATATRPRRSGPIRPSTSVLPHHPLIEAALGRSARPSKPLAAPDQDAAGRRRRSALRARRGRRPAGRRTRRDDLPAAVALSRAAEQPRDGDAGRHSTAG